jgi:hypothetical protein
MDKDDLSLGLFMFGFIAFSWCLVPLLDFYSFASHILPCDIVVPLGWFLFGLGVALSSSSLYVYLCLEEQHGENDSELDEGDGEDEEHYVGDFDEPVERKWELLANVTKEMGLLKASAMATRIDVEVQKLYAAKTTKTWRTDLPKIVAHIARYRHNGLLAPTVKLRKYLIETLAGEVDYCVACEVEDFECDSCRFAENTGYECGDDDSLICRFQDLVENEKPSLTRLPTDVKKSEVIPVTEKQTGFHCRYCGAVTPSDSKFCENCGANLEKTE